MAYRFNSSSSQYAEAVLAKTSAIPTAFPISIACWFKIASGVGTTAHALTGLTNSSGYGNNIQIGTDAKVYATTRVGGTSANSAVSSASVVQDTWHSAVGVFAGGSSRTLYLDGVSSNNTNARTFTTSDRVSIGRRIHSEAYLDGDIAEIAYWTVALTASEAKSLSLGVSPLLVRPDSLLYYFPFVRSSHELAEAESLTFQGVEETAQPSPHPRIYKK